MSHMPVPALRRDPDVRQMRMSETKSVLREITTDCAAHGLTVLAGLHMTPEDQLDGQTLLLIGNAGPDMWCAFAASAVFSVTENPLDAWSRRVLSEMAQQHGARGLFPFDGPPYHPFQRWALRTRQFSASPFGVLVHPTYGPWFAFRGALLLDEKIDLPHTALADPCGTCIAKPCIAACPVNAVHRDAPYDLTACREHVGTQNNPCFSTGCLSRHACPYGRGFAYTPEQARFHMAAFSR